MKKNNSVLIVIAIVLFWLVVGQVYGQEFVESTSAPYAPPNTQTWEGMGGIFYDVNDDDLNLTSITKVSTDLSTDFVVIGNESKVVYFTSNTIVSNVIQVGIILNASTTYFIGAYKSPCQSRTQAHDVDISGSFPVVVNKGNITMAGGSGSCLGGGWSWFYTVDDVYSIDSFNVSVYSVTPPADTPAITLSTNLSTGVYNTDISFNVTGVATNTTANEYNCTMYLNNTLNDTLLDVALNQTYVVFNLTYANQEVGFDVNVSCQRYEGAYLVVDDFQVTDVFLDSTPTDIEISSDFTNNTFFFRGINYLNFTITLNDTNLFAGNVSIFKLNPDGTINTTMNNTFQDSINTTGYTINYTGDRTIDIGNTDGWTVGRYMIRAEGWDDHTANSVKPVKIDYLTDGVLLDDEIKIYGSEVKETLVWLDDAYTDRFKFKFKFNEDSTQHSFFIETTDELIYRPASGYLGHFVYMPLGRWIDLENDNINGMKVSKLAHNKYEITVYLENVDDEIEFESIGDLNYASAEYFLNVSNSFSFAAVDGITNTTLTNFSIVIWDGATILWNSSTTTGNLSVNITSGGYITNAINVNYAHNTTNISFSAGGNYTWQLLAANSLYLFIYDEQTNTLINDRNVTIDVINYQNVSTTYTTDTGSTFQSGFSAGEYEINYKADNYTLRSYYVTISGSDTQSIDLYLLLTDEGAYNSYDVVDDSASALVNVTVSMQRYFITDNAWKTVEMSKSNEAGGGFLFVELYDAPYRFILEYQGTIEKITEQTKLDIRDLYFKLTLLDSGIEGFFDAGGVTVGLNFDNDTDVFTFTFVPVDVVVDSGTIVVDHSTAYVTTQICNTTLTAVSGGVTCNITAYRDEDGTFTAFGYLDMDADDQEQLVATISHSYTSRYMTFGLSGLFLAFLVVGTMAMVALWSPSVAIAMSLFGLFIVVQVGLIYITATWLVGTFVVGIIFIAHIKV